MSKVTIKNISNRKIGISIPELRVSRSILPGREIKMEKDVLEEALTFPGVPELFSKKYLIVEEVNDAIDLDIVDGDKVVTDESGNLAIEGTEDFEQLKTIIESGTDFQLKKLLSSENKYRQDVIAAAAAQSHGITLNKIQIIKDITGIDLQKIINVED